MGEGQVGEKLPPHQRLSLEGAIWGKLPSVLREKYSIDDARLAHVILDAVLEDLGKLGLEILPKHAGTCSVCGQPVHRPWVGGPTIDGEYETYPVPMRSQLHSHDRPWQVL